MKERICKQSFLFILLILHIVSIQAEVNDEKGRQTFVVRYKNGEQTIPVTVVLDYKKQTEYVINMNPRSPAKSVTLYDFKQRTIAFKDLTNGECFLGRLTHETLNHERNALHDLKNPVESRPKVLSLDPSRTALTPTEIRNIAGQKTAVFCRKMNTWLLIPFDTHKIKKREVEEIEERTYGHHGYHTVHYAHYGHETRRRYRIPSRSNSRHQSQKRQNAASNQNPGLGSNIFSERYTPRLQTSHSFTFPRSDQVIKNHAPTHNETETLVHNHVYDSMSFPDIGPFPDSVRSQKSNNVNHMKQDSEILLNEFNQPNLTSLIDGGKNFNKSFNSNNRFGYRIRSPINNFEAESSSVFGDTGNDYSKNVEPSFQFGTKFKVNERKSENIELLANNHSESDIQEKLHHDINTHVIEDSTTRGEEHLRTERDSGDDFPTAFPERAQEDNQKTIDRSFKPPPYKLSAEEMTSFIPNFHKSTSLLRQNQSHDSLNGHGSRYVETETDTGEEALFVSNNHTAREPLTKIFDVPETPQNPDVSINVLEIPKVTSRFENERNLALYKQENDESRNSLQTVDNSPWNHPVVQHEYFDNSFFSEGENNTKKQSLQNLPRVLHHEDHNHNSIGNRIYSYNNFPTFFPPTTTSSPTEIPIFTRSPFHEIRQVSTLSSYLLPVTTSVQESIGDKSSDLSSFSNVLDLNNHLSKYGSVQNEISAGSFPVQGNTFYDETDVDLLPKAYLTTESPAFQENDFRHSEHHPDKLNEDGKVEKRKEILASAVDNNKYPSSTPGVPLNESILPNHLKFQNVLRLFKPDEIIIDIEKIPTHPPPDSTSGFHRKNFTKTLAPSGIPFSSHTNIARSEQTVGSTWRSSYIQTTKQPRRRTNYHSQKPRPKGVSFHVRKNTISQQNSDNQSQNIHHRRVNPFHQYSTPQHLNSRHHVVQPHHFNSQRQFNQQRFLQSPPQVNRRPQLYQPQELNILPPGVSMHPRHPQAPYAHMIHSNRPPPLPQSTNVHMKTHRQRHHRKKDRFANSCCRNARKPGALLACCRNGGSSCCPEYHQQTPDARMPCCSSSKTAQRKQMFPVGSSTHSQVVQRTHMDNRDRCQKEKMCRTLYESTQQVMVCRKVDIEGC